MINENDLLEPRKAYEEILREEHRNNTVEYFDNLARESGADIEANKVTMQEYQDLINQEKKVAEERKKKRGLSAFLTTMGIILIVASIICFFIFFTTQKEHEAWMNVIFAYVVPIIVLALGIFILVLNGKKIRPVIKNQDSTIARLRSSQEEKKAIGRAQMKPLNDAYSWNMHVDIVNKTTPLIKLDKFFDFKRMQYLIDSFGFQILDDKDFSTVHVQSGEIIGNPFVIETYKIMSMGTYTYTGSLTITYRVRVPNGGKNGGYHYESRTQTLHASLTKPKPYFNYEKKLYYGCDAAPDLNFSRKPSGINKMNEDDVKKYINKQEKELAKLVEKDTNKSFTALGNKQFEALFHAWDRDNEVQFRLLFTPLAQKNYIDLIKNKEPYGDDFSFVKKGKLSTVQTEHSQYSDYVCAPDEFEDFSYESAKAKFVEKNEQYFKSFFFDMAAIISIPLFQQYPTDDYIFNKRFESNNTIFENEAMVNSLPYEALKPNKCSTDIIVNAEYVRNEGPADRINAIARGFETKEHVDYVPVYGKDGHWHDVPVHWIEYIKVQKTTQVEVVRHEISRGELMKKKHNPEFNNFINRRVLDGNIVYNKQFYSFVVPDGAVINENEFEPLLSKED